MTAAANLRAVNGERMEVVEAPPIRFQLTQFDKVSLLTSGAYLIKGLIPRSGLTVLWGPPKSGKSFVAFDMLTHVALDRPYRGRKVATGPVVYVVLEGDAGVRARIEAFRQHHLSEDAEPFPFFILTTRLDLVKDYGALVADIRRQLETSPVAVVLDTLNRSLSGSESKDEDMAAYVRAADAIRDDFSCAVIVIHHCGIDATRPRGHTSLTGAADAQLAVKRDADNNVILTVEWMKDGPEGDQIVSRLEPVSVGLDDDGDEITSCVVVPVDHREMPRPEPKRKLSDRAQVALETLADICGTHGRSLPPSDLPASIRAVPIETWRDELTRRGILTPDAKNPREDFRRVKEQLLVRHLVAEREGMIWYVPRS